MVVVTDQLHTNLDWSTFELTEIGFGDQLISIPAGNSYFATNVPMSYSNVDFDVQIEAGIRLANGQVYAIFRSLMSNGLPPSAELAHIGFLPPEDGTHRGQGHISYIVRAGTNTVTGADINNVALISFDNQTFISTDQIDPHDPAQGVDTNKQCLNTVDITPPESAISPLPAHSPKTFTVDIQGSDHDNAGIGSYDVYVSREGGAYTRWISGSTSNSAVITGEPGVIVPHVQRRA